MEQNINLYDIYLFKRKNINTMLVRWLFTIF